MGVAAAFPVTLAFLSPSVRTAVGMLKLLALQGMVDLPVWYDLPLVQRFSFGGLGRLDKMIILGVFDQVVHNH